MKEYIFVDNYGDMLAQVNGMELVSFEEDGGYQGQYVAVLKSVDSYKEIPDRLYYYKDYYGSCSGCDWLKDKGNDFSYSEENEVYQEREKLNKRYAVKYTDANEFCGGIKPVFVVPAGMSLTVKNNGEYNGFDIFLNT